MVMGGRELEAKMTMPSLPVTPGERERGPRLGQPVSKCHARWVSTPPVHLIMYPQPQPLKVPHPNVSVV